MEILRITTKARCQWIDITRLVEEKVREGGMKSGAVLLYVPHTTAGITVNENADPDVTRDVLFALQRAVPDQGFWHGEGNSDAHTKAVMTGASLNVIVEDGRLMLGTWQGIYFCEYDGPRNRQIYFKLLG